MTLRDNNKAVIAMLTGNDPVFFHSIGISQTLLSCSDYWPANGSVRHNETVLASQPMTNDQ
jgi:hypothetical protein